MAFVAAYVIHGMVIYPTVRHLTGLRLSSTNKRTMFVLFATAAFVLVAFTVLPAGFAAGAGGAATAIYAWYAVRKLARLVSAERLPGWLPRRIGWYRQATRYRHQRTS